jgi:hypothetical protein
VKNTDVATFMSRIDQLNAKDCASWLSEDGCMRFGAAPEVRGRTAIEHALTAFFAGLSSIRHEGLEICRGAWPGGPLFTVESTVTYTSLEGQSTPPLPVASVLRTSGKLIADYRIYLDPGPLRALDRPS